MNKKFIIQLVRVCIVATTFILWEYLSYKKIINPFVFSSPSKIIKCIYSLYKNKLLFNNIITTLKEIFISFSLSIILSFIISILFFELDVIYKIFEPFLITLNSMPKVALGPLIIILFGAGNTSIIIMSLSITLILNIIQIYNSIKYVDINLNKLLITLNANKYQKYKYLILPLGMFGIIDSLKINVSMTLIGVIMGEFLVSKEGIGYLIVYGSQVFNLTLVLSGTLILILISYIMHLTILLIEKKIKKILDN